VLHLTLALAALLAPAAPHVPRTLEPIAATPLETSRLLTAPDRKVRAYTPLLERYLERGIRRSPTFAAMMRALQETDVIVQLVEAVKLPPLTDAQTMLIQGAKEFRYVRVHVGTKRRGDDLVALIGHELMHALEIAWAPEVRDDAGLEALYRRIGERGPKPNQYDTQEARSIERLVHRELAGARVNAAANTGPPPAVR
jgi:hypothetical protein